MATAMDLTGKRALVCGASRGIGQAAALAIAELGAHVTVLARNEQALQAMVPQLLERGASGASVLVADLDDLPGLIQRVDADLAEHGAIQVVINNTGGPKGGPLVDAQPDAMLHAYSRHVLGAHTLMQRVLPGMKQSGFGRFIQILSTSVYEPIPNLGVSNLTRAAVAAWAKTLSREFPPGITINNVLPGFTDTQRLGQLSEGIQQRTGKTPEQVTAGWLAQVPEGRLAEPSELAAVIAFLASPAASFVRGQSIAVDGGRLRSI